MPTSISDDELRDFIVNGYCIVPPSASLDPAIHKRIYDRTYSVCEEKGHNPPKEPSVQDELWSNPDLTQVFSTPEVHSALEAILGSGYLVFPHRHMHTCSPLGGQEWHQDPTVFPVRSIRPRQVLAMYYPGDVDIEDGPTGFLPGSHYMALDGGQVEFDVGTQDLVAGEQANMIQCFTGRYDGQSFEDDTNSNHMAFDNARAGKALPLQPSYGVLKGGSFVINHYEIIHRGSMRLPSGKFRAMYKFLVLRLASPTPIPHLQMPFPEDIYADGGASFGQIAIWRCMWEWLTGARGQVGPTIDVDAVASSFLCGGDASYMELLGSACLLARFARSGSTSALDALRWGLEGNSQRVRKSAMFGLAEVGEPAIIRLLPLLEAPVKAQPSTMLKPLLVRTAATYALGELAGSTQDTPLLDRLIAALIVQYDAARAILVDHNARFQEQRLKESKGLSHENYHDKDGTGSAAFKNGSASDIDWAALKKSTAGDVDWTSAKNLSKSTAGRKGYMSDEIDLEKDGTGSAAFKKSTAGGIDWAALTKGAAGDFDWAACKKNAAPHIDWAALKKGAAGDVDWVALKKGTTGDIDWTALKKGAAANIDWAALKHSSTKDVSPEAIFARVMNNLLFNSAFALGNVAQGIAGKEGVPAFIAKLIGPHELASKHALVPFQHAPSEPDLLSLAVVSACTTPGAAQEARITEWTPPMMNSDRFAGMFLTVALARYKLSRPPLSASDDMAQALQQHLAIEKARLTSERSEAEKLKAAKLKEYEAEVLPKMFDGDAQPFYRIGT